MRMGHERIKNRADYELFKKLDLEAHGASRWLPHHAITKPELYYQRLLRWAEYTQTFKGAGKALYAVARVRLARYSLKTGISIPLGVFGPGLSIAHYGSIVVNDEARFGRFCRIHSATNVGVADGGVPKFGDFVYLAPGATVFGAVEVGSRSVIGANAVVNKDVPEGSTAVGAPARVLAGKDSRKSMPKWIAERMPLTVE